MICVTRLEARRAGSWELIGSLNDLMTGRYRVELARVELASGGSGGRSWVAVVQI